MTQEELNKKIEIYAIEVLSKKTINKIHNLDIYIKEHFKPIPRNKLIVDKKYKGYCRNTNEATWNGKEFVYDRYKFGSTFKDTINHYEDDDGYDLFIPIIFK